MTDITLIFTLILSALMAAVFIYDLTRYVIPNWLNLAVLLLYPVYVVLSPADVDVLYGLLALGAVFAGGFALFAFNIMGAGDIKLLCALALWCGWSETLLKLLVYTGLLGGALALGIYILRLTLPALLAKRDTDTHIPRLLTHGEPVPYGLAISVAFLILLWSEEVI